MGRLIDEDELIKGRVENDPVVIAAKCAPTAAPASVKTMDFVCAP